jgi:hypothetical protein
MTYWSKQPYVGRMDPWVKSNLTLLDIRHLFFVPILQEGLNASRNLKVLQSYEELEAAFEPGKEFCFDAVIHLE